MFAHPSLGTRARHCGRRHSSPPAKLPHCFLCTSPTIVISRSCRSCRACSSPPRTSPPARTHQTDTSAVVVGCRGPNCELTFCFKVPCARNRGPLARLLISVSCQLVKSIGMCRKIQKLPNQFCRDLEI
jgi:hypothetical protein